MVKRSINLTIVVITSKGIVVKALASQMRSHDGRSFVSRDGPENIHDVHEFKDKGRFLELGCQFADGIRKFGDKKKLDYMPVLHDLGRMDRPQRRVFWCSLGECVMTAIANHIPFVPVVRPV